MKRLLLSGVLLISGLSLSAQHIEFEEYDLENGLHVILHQDRSTPVVITSVMYHVGAKDENPERTGFAHFFEHLLFEGTKNIARGEWDKLVSSNGGRNNANTSDDRTYYYEVMPSNNLQLILWMESERMLHPVINQIGVETQREVVKEEKRQRYDNSPYGQWVLVTKQNLFEKHPYRWSAIGSMDHIDAATLDEFKAFHDKFYVPNNAVLVVAGDFDTKQAKEWINEYFSSIPKGTDDISKKKFEETPITQEKRVTFEDPNIQLPMLVNAYRAPSETTRDAKVLELISEILSGGKSSRLQKRLVDDDKMAMQTGVAILGEEDYSPVLFYTIPLSGNSLDEVQVVIDEEVKKLQTDLISEAELEKLMNVLETAFVKKANSVENIAHELATYYTIYGNTGLINTEIDEYRTITREEIRDIARKYLNPNQRIVVDYVPAKRSN